MTLVGNDIVDLSDPRCPGKADDARFVERVFSPREARRIAEASDPNRLLWLFWAGKEAAFKVVTKLQGTPPPFRHAAFEVESDAGDGGGSGPGHVSYRGTRVPFRAYMAPDRIHLTAWYAREGAPRRLIQGVRKFREPGEEPPEGWADTLRERFTEREWSSVHSAASALVRLRARNSLARTLDVAEETVEIVCDEGPPGRAPPRVFVEGRRWSGDLSLSHHGRFLAWAFTAPAG